MSSEIFCWWCTNKLTHGSDGRVVKRTLIVEDQREVSVHVACEPEARAFLKPLTASPPSEEDTRIVDLAVSGCCRCGRFHGGGDR